MDKTKVKTLSKAIDVLDCFLGNSELGVTEISVSLNLYKSNVHNILSTYEKHGYIEKNQKTGKYRLGCRILELSHSLSVTLGFRKNIYPQMKKLADEVGEVVYYGVPNELDVLYLDAAYPGFEYYTRSMLGERANLYCTGIGKAILSHMKEAAWNSLFDKPLRKFTENTISDPNFLIKELALIKERGYSIDNMEHEIGIKCIGVPVFDNFDNVVAGLSISCPSPRMDHDKELLFAEKLKELSRNISKYMN